MSWRQSHPSSKVYAVWPLICRMSHCVCRTSHCGFQRWRFGSWSSSTLDRSLFACCRLGTSLAQAVVASPAWLVACGRHLAHGALCHRGQAIGKCRPRANVLNWRPETQFQGCSATTKLDAENAAECRPIMRPRLGTTAVTLVLVLGIFGMTVVKARTADKASAPRAPSCPSCPSCTACTAHRSTKAFANFAKALQHG